MNPKLSFAHPEVFIYFLILIPLAALFFIHYRRRFPLILRLIAGGRSGMHNTAKQNTLCQKLRFCYISSAFFFLLFTASMIFALAAPRMGSRLVREFRRGCDVVLAIDVSRSMTVPDAPPRPGSEGASSTRLERAVWLAENLVLASEEPVIPQDSLLFLRFALALGKGQGVLTVPMTSDSETIMVMLDALSSSIMTSRGTNLEKLIESAAGGFMDNAPAGRQIILFSDGESLSGSLAHAVERAKLQDITVIAVGVGSLAGALVPEKGEAADADGATLVRSFLHADLLKSAVERSGGAYIDGNSGDALNQLAEKIFPLAGDSSWTFREEAGSQWHIFAIAGLIFLLISKALTLTLRRN